MRFIGWILVLSGAAATVAGLLMSGMAPGGEAADVERLVAKVTLVLFGCGLGISGAVFIVGGELRLWLSAIYDELGGEEAPQPVREDKARVERSRASRGRIEPGLQRAEPVIV